MCHNDPFIQFSLLCYGYKSGDTCKLHSMLEDCAVLRPTAFGSITAAACFELMLLFRAALLSQVTRASCLMTALCCGRQSSAPCRVCLSASTLESWTRCAPAIVPAQLWRCRMQTWWLLHLRLHRSHRQGTTLRHGHCRSSLFLSNSCAAAKEEFPKKCQLSAHALLICDFYAPCWLITAIAQPDWFGPYMAM